MIDAEAASWNSWVANNAGLVTCLFRLQPYTQTAALHKTMDNFDMNYSSKNIPLPSKREYLKHLLEMTENYITRLRWKAFFLRKESDPTSSNDSISDNSDNKEDSYNETFGLKSKRTLP